MIARFFSKKYQQNLSSRHQPSDLPTPKNRSFDVKEPFFGRQKAVLWFGEPTHF